MTGLVITSDKRIVFLCLNGNTTNNTLCSQEKCIATDPPLQAVKKLGLVHKFFRMRPIRRTEKLSALQQIRGIWV